MKRLIVFLMGAFYLWANAYYVVTDPSQLGDNSTIVNDLVYRKINDSCAAVCAVFLDPDAPDLGDEYYETHYQTFDIKPWVEIGGDSLPVTTIESYALGVEHFVVHMIMPPTLERLEPHALRHVIYIDSLWINSVIPPFTYLDGLSIDFDQRCMDHVLLYDVFVPEGAEKYYHSAPGWRSLDTGHTRPLYSEQPDLESGRQSETIFDCDGWVAQIIPDSNNEVEIYFRVLDKDEFELDIPAELTHNGQTYHVTSLGRELFHDTHYTKVHVPESVRLIHQSAFRESNVEELTGLEGVTHIEAFGISSKYLQSLILPASLKVIGPNVLNCKAKLDYLELPDKLESVDLHAFRYVSVREAVCRNPKVPEATDESFLDNRGLGTLIVPDESVDDYRQAPGWRLFSQIVGLRQAGVDPVGSADIATARARYYNLQGIEVTSPRKGETYIECRGSNLPRKVVF